jgi:transcriptional regulator with XRE-family HTH domain
MLRQVEKQECEHANMENLAKRLIQAREDKGWSKADLKRAAKLKSPSTLTEIENGKRTESPQLAVIAAALGVEVLWLQHGIGPKSKDDNTQAKVSPIPKRQDPSILAVVKLMEETDDAGRIKALEGVKWALKDHAPIRKHRAN